MVTRAGQGSSEDVGVKLELDLQAQLHLTGRRAAERTGRARQHRRDGPDSRVPDGRVRVRKLRMVEDVEGLIAELGVEPPDLRVLDQARIEVHRARSAQN